MSDPGKVVFGFSLGPKNGQLMVAAAHGCTSRVYCLRTYWLIKNGPKMSKTINTPTQKVHPNAAETIVEDHTPGEEGAQT